MHISDAGLRLIEEFEGFSSRPYWDEFGRVWTRGFGETEGITASSPAISRHQGEEHLRQLIETRYEWALRDLGVELNQNQWDALCSFVWNLGAGIFTGGLRAALQGRDWGAAARLMLSYDHAGGVELAGLKRRRELETQLFLRPAAPDAPYAPPDERRWIAEWDRLRGVRTPAAHLRRLRLKRAMTARWHLIVHLAVRDGWDQLNRDQRLRELLARTI